MKAFIIGSLIVLSAACPIWAATNVGTVSATAKPSVTKEAATMTSAQRAESYFAQGYLYYSEGSYKLAIPEFIKALKYSPNMVKARYWLAKSSYQLKNYQSAINQCDAALKIEPNNKNVRNLRAEALSKLAPAPKKTVAAASITPTMEVKATAEAKPIATAKPTVTVKPVATKEAVKAVKKEAVRTEPVIKEKKRTISMDLRNVDISTVLQIFSKETGISVISGKDVYGKVTVILNNVTPEDALDMILKSNGYTYTRNGNIVEVYSSGEPNRVENLPGGVFVRTFQVNYIGPEELKDTMTKLMPEGATIYTTKGSKTVVVKGSANDIRRAEVVIRNLDIPPRQVMVEAKIVEVSLNDAQSLGTNMQYINPDNPNEIAQTVGFASPASATGAKGLYYTVTDQTMTKLVDALSTRTGFNVLSSPKVMALNEQKAEIITGSRLGYKVKTVTTTGMVESVEFLDVGTKLVITPSIKSDGLIVMDIHPEISEGAIVGDLPQKNSTETTTQLIVKDGQTIVIGGLIRDTSKKEVSGVPVLMDIPFIGMMFKRTSLTSEKKEVIVLITPHIVTPRLISEMEGQINRVENQRQNISPIMPLDLAR